MGAVLEQRYTVGMTWNYIAGFFDGEGHVGLSNDGKHTGRQQVSVAIANTHIQTLSEIRSFLAKQNIASKIYIRKRTIPRYKPCGMLTLTDHIGKREFLRALLDLSITKREAIAKAIHHIESKEWLIPFDDNTMKSAMRSYKSGDSLRDIERSHGISSRTIRKHAKRFGVDMRPRGEAISAAKLKRRHIGAPVT